MTLISRSHCPSSPYEEGDPETARMVLIGEAPAGAEMKNRRPFCGPAGYVLNELLASIGLDRSELYITNVSREPVKKASELVSRGVWTDRGVYECTALDTRLNKCTAANIFVTMGDTAMRALLQDPAPILKQRGSVLETKLDSVRGGSPLKVIPTIHPAACLRGMFLWRYSIRADLLKAVRHSAFPERRLLERELITDPSYRDCLHFIRDTDFRQKAFGYDIECTNDEISCLSIAQSPTLAMCIPFRYYQGRNRWSLEEEHQIWIDIARLHSNENVPMIGQNLLFDTSFQVERLSIHTECIIKDTMIAHDVIYPEFPMGLDFIVSNYTDEPYYKDEGKMWEKPLPTDEDYDQFWVYNNKDSTTTMEIWPQLEQELEKKGYTSYYDDVINILPALRWMQARGTRVNRTKLAETHELLLVEIARKRKEIEDASDYQFSPDSPKQLQEYFYNHKKIKPYISRDTKNPTTNDKALQRLWTTHGLQEAKLVQEYRTLAKLQSTYIEVELDPDDRLRCSYNPRGTETGRLSSSKTLRGTGLNNQNLTPRFMAFLEPDKDHIFLDFDKRQAEWIIVAYEAQEEQMLAAIEAGLDTHIHTAHIMTGVPKDIIAKEAKITGHSTDPEFIQKARETHCREIFNCGAIFLPRTMSVRQAGKKSNHGLNYGLRENRFAMEYEVPLQEARIVVYAYSNRVYPKLPKWHSDLKKQISSSRTLINCLSQKRYFYDKIDDDLHRKAYSQLPQSTVVGIVNRAMTSIENDSSLDELEMLRQVHDSIACQALYEDLPALAKICHKVRDYMDPLLIIHNRSFSIPTDLKIGFNARDMVEVNINQPVNDLAEELGRTIQGLKQDEQVQG